MKVKSQSEFDIGGRETCFLRKYYKRKRRKEREKPTQEIEIEKSIF